MLPATLLVLPLRTERWVTWLPHAQQVSPRFLPSLQTHFGGLQHVALKVMVTFSQWVPPTMLPQSLRRPSPPLHLDGLYAQPFYVTPSAVQLSHQYVYTHSSRCEIRPVMLPKSLCSTIQFTLK